MIQYINKDALVAEIERRKNICNNVVTTSETPVYIDYYQGKAEAYKETINLLDTFEVKEADLTREDVSKIISIDQQVCGTMGVFSYARNHQQAMEEVLKRFKAQKGE